MTIFKFGRDLNFNKFVAQLGREGRDYMIQDFVEGCLLDSVLIAGPRGFYVLLETYLNANSSTYTVYFANYRRGDDVDALQAIWEAAAGGASVVGGAV